MIENKVISLEELLSVNSGKRELISHILSEIMLSPDIIKRKRPTNVPELVKQLMVLEKQVQENE